MTAPLKIAVAGLGTVGAGTLKLLRANADAIATKCGRAIVVSAVSARDRKKDRGVDLSSVAWFDDPVAMATQAAAVWPKPRGLPVVVVRGRDGKVVFAESGSLFPEDVQGLKNFL